MKLASSGSPDLAPLGQTVMAQNWDGGFKPRRDSDIAY